MAAIYILSEKKYAGAENLPCINIRFLPQKIDVSDYDALIFSSKNGVAAMEQCNKAWKEKPSFAIGLATCEAIQSLNGSCIYQANSSYGDHFAKEIKSRLKGKKVLFIRPKVVTSSLNTILLDAGVLLDEAVLYETICAKCEQLKKPEKNAVIIFSSPSTISCFFNCFSWDESYQAVVIGEKTASYMPLDIHYQQANKQTIPSCIETAYKLSQN